MLSSGSCSSRANSDVGGPLFILPSNSGTVNCSSSNTISYASRLPPVTTLKRNFHSTTNNFGHKQSCDSYQTAVGSGSLSSIPVPPISVETLVIPQPVTHHNITISEESVFNSGCIPLHRGNIRSSPNDSSEKLHCVKGIVDKGGKGSVEIKTISSKDIGAGVPCCQDRTPLNHHIISISKIPGDKFSVNNAKKAKKLSESTKNDSKDTCNALTVPSSEPNVIDVLNSLNLGASFIIIKKGDEARTESEKQCENTLASESMLKVELKDYIEQVFSLRCRLCSYLTTDLDIMLNHVQDHLTSRHECYSTISAATSLSSSHGEVLTSHAISNHSNSLSFCHGGPKALNDKCSTKSYETMPLLEPINSPTKEYVDSRFVKNGLSSSVSSDLSLSESVGMTGNTLVIPPNVVQVSAGESMSSDDSDSTKLTQSFCSSSDVHDAPLPVSSIAQIVNSSTNCSSILPSSHMSNSLLDLKSVKLLSPLPSVLPPDLSSIDSNSLLKQVHMISTVHHSEDEEKAVVRKNVKAVKKQGRPKGSKSTSLSTGNKKKDSVNAERNSKEKSWTRCHFTGCPVKLKLIENLEYHQKCHSPADPQHPFCCPECGEKYNGWKGMSLHLWKSHSLDMELYSCDQCPYKTFSHSKLVNLHKRIHGHERPFLCDHCGKGFKTTKQLRNHKVIHVKKKKIAAVNECNVCQRSFADKRMLKLHLETVHLKMKPFLCNFCGYSASSRSTLKMHLRVHTGEKPFHCEECNYKTSDHNSLRRHKMRHSGEKKYSCPYCAYACIQSSTFKMHLKNKHPGQADGLMYSCTKCTYRTVKKDNFAVHWSEHESAEKLKQEGEVKEEKTLSDDHFDRHAGIIQYIGSDMVHIMQPLKGDEQHSALTTCENSLLSDSNTTYVFPNSFQQIIRLTPVTEGENVHIEYSLQGISRITAGNLESSADEFSLCHDNEGDFQRISYVELQNCSVEGTNEKSDISPSDDVTERTCDVTNDEPKAVDGSEVS